MYNIINQKIDQTKGKVKDVEIINSFQFFDEKGKPLTFIQPITNITNITFIGVPNNDPIHYCWNVQTVGHVYFANQTHQIFLFDFKRKKAFLLQKEKIYKKINYLPF